MLYKTRKISDLIEKATIGLTIAFGGVGVVVAATTTVGGVQVVYVAMSIGGILLLFTLYKDYDVD